MTIVEFLRARLNADERRALSLPTGARHWTTDGIGSWLQIGEDGGSIPIDGYIWGEDIGAEDVAQHIARFDPARMLREVGASRALVDAYERLLDSRAHHRAAMAEWEVDRERAERGEPIVGYLDVRMRGLRREADYLDAMEPMLRGLVLAKAAAYDHPDYDPAWGGA